MNLEVDVFLSELTDRINELRLENRRLKQQIEEFEKRVLALVGNIVIESSGEGDNKELLNEKLIELIQTTQYQLNIVTPKISVLFPWLHIVPTIAPQNSSAGPRVPFFVFIENQRLSGAAGCLGKVQSVKTILYLNVLRMLQKFGFCCDRELC